MRDMAEPTPDAPHTPAPSRWRNLSRLRPWVQTAMLGVWLAPLSTWLARVPSCVFHCYACPLASLACPVGVVANFSAWHVFPYMAVGMLLAVGAGVGSLVCGWACPFGYIQDLLERLPLPKFRLPNWTGYGRYVMLLGAVILVPYFWGEAHALFICRICPAGALEAAVPRMVMGAAGAGPLLVMGLVKWIILAAFLLSAVVTFRPWCKVFCPLGGFLSLFNHVSLFRLQFSAPGCTECNTCRSRCRMGGEVERKVNTGTCIRCTECTTCGAIEPALAKSQRLLPPPPKA
ncbi:MAG: 4Fe-4S binding protein [Planctomycetota bacterium]|nr:4Fe-4S binding protein [Planctomycetota bacterium]